MNKEAGDQFSCAWRGAGKRFFISPHFEQKFSADGFCSVDHGAHQAPAAFFVEAPGANVADGACQPRRPDALPCQPHLGFVDQCCSDPSATCGLDDEELVKLCTLDEAQSKRRADGTDDPGVGQFSPDPLSKVFDWTEASEFHWHDLRVRVMPGLMPQCC